MKRNLLKQSVIAVLVGGAVSGSVLAKNIDTDNKDSTNFTKGIRNSIVVAIQGNLQILNGFKKGEETLAVNDNNKLEKRDATDDDVNSDPLKGKGVVNSVLENQADIATHTQRLDNLDNRVNNLNKDLKRGLAAQAALNGLFQPYNVGKLNLTAAVGGYKSQTAVAVGTGYRHNENVATKAGVAFTHGGSATYNVGVNFEW